MADIFDAAYKAYDDNQPHSQGISAVVNVVQVAVLRELEGRFMRISENWTLLGDLARASVYGVEASYLRGKLDDLLGQEAKP